MSTSRLTFYAPNIRSNYFFYNKVLMELIPTVKPLSLCTASSVRAIKLFRIDPPPISFKGVNFFAKIKSLPLKPTKWEQ